jgi:hypothetical protein
MNQFPDIPSDIKKQLAFTCAYEKDRIPPRDPEADQLHTHARWLIKANTLRQVPEAYPSIERLLRIATAHEHDRANVELRHMLEKGRAQSDDLVNETIDLVQDLIKRDIPAGYCGRGRYLENCYGVREDQELASSTSAKRRTLGIRRGKTQDDPIFDLGQAPDPERKAWCKKVREFLFDYSYLNPQVPELDTIVPLPPAKLPPWDGKFKWLEVHEANVPPSLPTDERIAEMAKTKGLDPETGRRVEVRK